MLDDLQKRLNSCPVIEGNNYKINPYIPGVKQFNDCKFSFGRKIQKISPGPDGEKILVQRSGYNSHPQSGIASPKLSQNRIQMSWENQATMEQNSQLSQLMQKNEDIIKGNISS